jgi:hypothetical protein
VQVLLDATQIRQATHRNPQRNLVLDLTRTDQQHKQHHLPPTLWLTTAPTQGSTSSTGTDGHPTGRARNTINSTDLRMQQRSTKSFQQRSLAAAERAADDSQTRTAGCRGAVRGSTGCDHAADSAASEVSTRYLKVATLR